MYGSKLNEKSFSSSFASSSFATASVDKLPSISSSIDFQSSKQAAREHFLQTPLISGRRRDPLDCFGVSEQDVEPLDKIFSRANLRTPPEIREYILRERREQQERKEKSIQFAKQQREQQRIASRERNTLIGFGRGLKQETTKEATKDKSAAQATASVKPSTKRTIIGDAYDISAKPVVADETSKFYFSENEKEQRKAKREEKAALLQSRKEKAIAERSAKIEKAQSVKNSQKMLLENDFYDPQFEEVKHKFVGAEAKEDFMRLYLRSRESNYLYPNDCDMPDDLQNPHLMMIRDQARRNLSPLPLIIRTEDKQKGVFLAHKGLGDERVLPIISVLDTLPAVYTIDLSDNRLTDESLMPLALKLNKLTHLTSLNLSFNKIDDSSETIMEYLRSRDCKLKVLTLNGADVDDGECCNLMDAISDNRSIESLSLSNNLIGKKESLNTVYPDLLTGGEAIAQLLETTMTIKFLDISWNFIRLASAEEIGKAMAINMSLRVLNVAHNAFGDLGAQLLGASLKVNKVLKELDISYNSLIPRSATVLANALGYNETLTNVNLSGNVIGRIGMQSLVAAIQRSAGDHRVLKVLFENCDVEKVDPTCFNASNPNGTWEVQLDNPYGQMVIEECIFISNYRAGCNIVSLHYEGQPIILIRKETSKERSKYPVDEFHAICIKISHMVINDEIKSAAELLQTMMQRQFGFVFDRNSGQHILRTLREQWFGTGKDKNEELEDVFLFEVFHSVFIINDLDFSGTLELEEFRQTLATLGKPNFDREVLRRLMAEHDIDDSGTIDANEFAMIMVNHFCSSNVPRGSYVDASTGKPWIIPKTGVAVIVMTYECDLPDITDVGGDDGIDSVICAIQDAKTDVQKVTIFEQAVNSPYFFLNAEQAQLLFDEIIRFTKKPLETIAEILPQLVCAEECVHFLDDNLDEIGKLELRVKLGPLYNAYIGTPTGHYCLDLEKIKDIKGGKKISALSIHEAKASTACGINTSQLGRPTCFRNSVFNDKPVHLDGMWFSSCANTGTVRCDYVSTTRPRQGTKALSNARYQRLKMKLDLGELTEEIAKWAEIDAHRREEDSELDGSDDDSMSNSLDSRASSPSLARGPRSISPVDDVSTSSRKRTSVDSQLSRNNAFTGSNASGSSVGREVSNKMKRTVDSRLNQRGIHISPPLTIIHVREQFAEYIKSSHHYLDIFPDERKRMDVVSNARPSTPPFLSTGPKPNPQAMHPLYALGYRKLLELQIIMPSVFLSVGQIFDLIECFPTYGYLRVQLLQTVFAHVVDLENFWQLIDGVLSEDERLEALHRLGMLNVYDSLTPDRQYKLDLRKWDQREMAKILIELAVEEPGSNWVNETFRWSKYDEPIPGWVLPQGWTTADEDMNGDGGPRRHGWLIVEYTSVGQGCAPNAQVRKNLRRKLLTGMKKLL